MKILRKRREGSWVLHLIGPLARGKGVWVLREGVKELVRRGQRFVILDVAGVPYLDAAGIGEILRCHRRVRAAGGRLVLVAASPKVQEILRLSMVSDQVPTIGRVDEALRSQRRWRRRGWRRAQRDDTAAHDLSVAPFRKGPAIIRRTGEGPWRFTPIHG